MTNSPTETQTKIIIIFLLFVVDKALFCDVNSEGSCVDKVFKLSPSEVVKLAYSLRVTVDAE